MGAKLEAAEGAKAKAEATAVSANKEAAANKGGGTTEEMEQLRAKLTAAETANQHQKEEEESLLTELDDIGKCSFHQYLCTSPRHGSRSSHLLNTH